ncbi:hypothetical protein EV11_0112 [Prochlorococcus sp. SS52]|nr:hypothetical protein EV04_1403 [Prochlorococcus marinus str. LG]KGG18720.1 hypothetical protein EV08_1969 [Prochlorococcus marinus str. SS2]KGG22994.1 hypothetical protein EV09_1737 [Prochlorococcus marinus str. SS35]KGG34097.1 hypothetical protein EV10_0134 [Prochlorococcus marinus str. SS51]KGG37553.1 hypothetical protein EV11_0112 [Prochlorococcus sp. SS52]
MTWLLILILILQSGFHWILKPTIFVGTYLLEFRSLGLISIFLILWFFSGRGFTKETYED